MTTNKKVELVAKGLRWFSDYDEAAFFEWLKKIPCIETYKGQGKALHIEIDQDRLDDVCLREMLALFYRFKQEMSQLAVFKDEKKRPWFSNNSRAYWYRQVFGSVPRK
jgi:hypothetical protein